MLSTSLTGSLATHRLGVNYDLITSLSGCSLIDSGHVLGGKALLVKAEGESTLYTGDFSPHDRFFLKGLKPVKCDNLIIETTYGSPSYDLPSPRSIIKIAHDTLEDDLALGYNVVLHGYALGKAQIICKLVEGLGNVFAHDKVRGVNGVCQRHGCDVSVPDLLPSNAGSFIYVTPSIKDARKFAKARVYSFSGWGFSGVRDCFPLSDHAGFSDLLRFVKGCKPSHVFTHHGFSEEFASLLRVEGYDAKSFD